MKITIALAPPDPDNSTAPVGGALASAHFVVVAGTWYIKERDEQAANAGFSLAQIREIAIEVPDDLIDELFAPADKVHVVDSIIGSTLRPGSDTSETSLDQRQRTAIRLWTYNHAVDQDRRWEQVTEALPGVGTPLPSKTHLLLLDDPDGLKFTWKWVDDGDELKEATVLAPSTFMLVPVADIIRDVQ